MRRLLMRLRWKMKSVFRIPGIMNLDWHISFLLVKFKNGHFAKSTVSPKVITSFIVSEEHPNFPYAELIEAVNPGEPLSKVTLRFDRFYDNNAL